MLPKVIIIAGPTASGKTALSLKLAKKFNGEIVSTDSRQIYREMDIGTAKASKKELKSVPHHLISIKNPNQDYTLAQFKTDAVAAIKKITLKNKISIIVGGTGLYLNALINNLEIPEVRPNLKLRKKLEKQADKYGIKRLYHELIKLDPKAANIIDPKNPRRIIRAMEITLGTGKPFSSQRKSGPKLFDFLVLGVALPKNELVRKINKRADQMFKTGLMREVKKLIKKYGKKT
ncbi:tRNA (adenosine(37)-N6)-dimethylallyltransferase MiaA, partial [bacterium]